MKKVKLVFWLILIAFLALLAFQNWDYFMSQHGLRINLFVAEYHTPPLQNAVLLLIFFFVGLLFAYFFTLFERFKSQRKIKSITASLQMSEKLLDELKKEIQTLKGGSPPQPDNSDVASPSHANKDSDVS